MVDGGQQQTMVVRLPPFSTLIFSLFTIQQEEMVRRWRVEEFSRSENTAWKCRLVNITVSLVSSCCSASW